MSDYSEWAATDDGLMMSRTYLNIEADGSNDGFVIDGFVIDNFVIDSFVIPAKAGIASQQPKAGYAARYPVAYPVVYPTAYPACFAENFQMLDPGVRRDDARMSLDLDVEIGANRR